MQLIVILESKRSENADLLCELEITEKQNKYNQKLIYNVDRREYTQVHGFYCENEKMGK